MLNVHLGYRKKTRPTPATSDRKIDTLAPPCGVVDVVRLKIGTQLRHKCSCECRTKTTCLSLCIHDDCDHGF